MPRLGLALLTLSATLMLGGCGGDGQGVGDTPTPDTTETAPRQSTGCPQLTSTPGRAVAVDYTDFIQANGILYVIAEELGLASVPAGVVDIGAQQFLVPCSLSQLNEQTHEAPPAPRDGDAAFVPEGTPVYAVNGWATSCRQAAQHDGSWHVYLATDAHSSTAKPQPCAVPST